LSGEICENAKLVALKSFDVHQGNIASVELHSSSRCSRPSVGGVR
jgi:hypothetical protein